MRAIRRLLSLGFSATFTAAVRGRARLKHTPPHPFGLSLLLPVLLAVVMNVQADTIFLKSDTELYQVQSTATQAPTSLYGTRTTYYQIDQGYTNGVGLRYRSEQFNVDPYVYTTANGATRQEGSFNSQTITGTNTQTSLWVDGGLATGTDTNCTDTLDSRWQLSGGSWITVTTNNPGGYTNTSWTPPAVPNPSYYVGWDYKYSETNDAGDGAVTVATTTWRRQNEVLLITDTNTSTTGSSLYKLLSGFGIPYYTNNNSAADSVGKYTFADKDPDANGAVWKVLADGTTNAVNVAINSDYTCGEGAITNFTFQPYPQRATLGLQWKSANTNDTNWQSGPLFVLKGTTVAFRVQASTGGTNDPTVVWPSGLPTWSHGGTAGDTQISVTFNTVSADTNGQWVTVTAGSMASNQVVVFDYSVKFQPDYAGQFGGRATYPTNFGVGEGVNFIAKFDPDGITPSVTWSATGMSTAGASADRSAYTQGDASFLAGAFTETITVIGTLTGVPSAGKTRTNQFAVIRPTDAFLQDVLLLWTNNIWLSNPTAQAQRILDNPKVGHTTNTMGASKWASYFLDSRDVSFHGIKVREGTGPSTWDGGLSSITNAILFTNSNGDQLFTISYSFGTNASHATGELYSVSHPLRFAWGPVEPNYWCADHFLGSFDVSSTNLPVLVSHVPQRIATLTVTIEIEFNYKTADMYLITNVISLKEIYTSGRVVIRKARSGPHSKEYADPTSPD